VLTGVITLRIELKDTPRCLLTTDVDYARKQLTEIGAAEAGVRDLSKSISGKCRGVALLTTIK